MLPYTIAQKKQHAPCNANETCIDIYKEIKEDLIGEIYYVHGLGNTTEGKC